MCASVPGRRCWAVGGQHVRVRAALVPRPDQGLGRVEQGVPGVAAGAGGRLLVHLLLHVFQRGLQVQRGQ